MGNICAGSSTAAVKPFNLSVNKGFDTPKRSIFCCKRRRMLPAAAQQEQQQTSTKKKASSKTSNNVAPALLLVDTERESVTRDAVAQHEDSTLDNKVSSQSIDICGQKENTLPHKLLQDSTYVTPAVEESKCIVQIWDLEEMEGDGNDHCPALEMKTKTVLSNSKEEKPVSIIKEDQKTSCIIKDIVKRRKEDCLEIQSISSSESIEIDSISEESFDIEASNEESLDDVSNDGLETEQSINQKYRYEAFMKSFQEHSCVKQPIKEQLDATGSDEINAPKFNDTASVSVYDLEEEDWDQNEICNEKSGYGVAVENHFSELREEDETTELGFSCDSRNSTPQYQTYQDIDQEITDIRIIDLEEEGDEDEEIAVNDVGYYQILIESFTNTVKANGKHHMQ